jgi:hypothetical protein
VTVQRCRAIWTEFCLFGKRLDSEGLTPDQEVKDLTQEGLAPRSKLYLGLFHFFPFLVTPATCNLVDFDDRFMRPADVVA